MKIHLPGLLMILLLQIVAGILGAVYKSQIEGVLNQTLEKEIDALKIASANDKDILEGFHKLEIKYKCCGMLNGKSDLGQNIFSSHGCECDQTDIGTRDCVGKHYVKTCATCADLCNYGNVQEKYGYSYGDSVWTGIYRDCWHGVFNEPLLPDPEKMKPRNSSAK